MWDVFKCTSAKFLLMIVVLIKLIFILISQITIAKILYGKFRSVVKNSNNLNAN